MHIVSSDFKFLLKRFSEALHEMGKGILQNGYQLNNNKNETIVFADNFI